MAQNPALASDVAWGNMFPAAEQGSGGPGTAFSASSAARSAFWFAAATPGFAVQGSGDPMPNSGGMDALDPLTHFPRLNLSEIREELYAGNDLALSPFEDEFDQFAKQVLSTVRRTRRCSERQADVICAACQVAHMRIVRRAQESA